MTITTDTTLLNDPRRQAALLYWQGFSVPQIAEMLQTKRPTVQSWKQRDQWEETAPLNPNFYDSSSMYTEKFGVVV